MGIKSLFVIASMLLFTFCKAQDSVILSNETPEVREYLVSYLKLGGEVMVKDEEINLYTREVFENIESNSGIYIFGLMETHSKEYIYLKESGKIEIIDAEFISDAIIKVGLFIRRNNISDPDVIEDFLVEISKTNKRNINRLPAYSIEKD
jgi:hypothetical protein